MMNNAQGWSLEETKGFHFSDKKFLSFRELEKKSSFLAHYFKSLNPSNLPIVVSFPTHELTVCVYFAALKLGVSLIPSSVPRRRYDRAKLKTIIEETQPGLVFVESKEVLEDITPPKFTKVLDKKELLTYYHTYSEGLSLEEYADQDIQLIQFSSGSTHKPKGVKLNKERIFSNLDFIQKSLNLTPADRLFSWLPFHHDMGLIGSLLVPARFGIDTVIMSPQEFALHPLKWLEGISKNHCSVTAAPNFAYDLCVNRLEKNPELELDLSCLRAAVNGSEFVKAQTIERFYEAFKKFGFKKEAMKPAYGLAEATLLVSMTNGSLEMNKFSRSLLETGVAKKCDICAETDVSLVSSGKPPSGIDLCVVDRQTFEDRLTYHIGEIWVKSPSLSLGYVNPAKTQTDVFNQKKSTGEEGYLRTGDTGFLDESGNLYITGRLKDSFTINGKNIMADDIESVVQEFMFHKHTDASYRCAALCLHQQADASLIVIQEVPHKFATKTILKEIESEIFKTFHVKVEKVVLTKRGGLPRTTSGKIKRHAAGVLLGYDLLEVFDIT